MTTETRRRRWEHVKNDVRRRWERLTTDDVEAIHGNADKLVAVLQRRYGYEWPRAEREIALWKLSLAS